MPSADLFQWLETECPDDRVPDVLEAIASAIPGGVESVPGQKFEAAVREALYAARISYNLVGVEMVPFKSMEMHTAVVEPTLRLLSGRPDLDAVEDAYQKALREIADGEADDAITDAARAVEEMLKALGCEGNSIGPRLSDARKKGLIAGHDVPLLGQVAKAADWVSAERSERGDAHTSPVADREDAWLAVHIAGAFILRMAGGTPR